MACAKLSSSVPSVALLVLVMLRPGVALKLEPDGTSSHFPPLLDCVPAAAAPSKNDSAFRANVLSLLQALPSAAAATGSGATRSGGAGRDRAFARGVCFGFPTPGDCAECLSAAAQDVAGGCRGRRRAGVWRAGCFLSYADTNASTAREDAYRGWFYDDDGDGAPTAALGSQCATNRTVAECSRCLNESARVVPALKDGGQLSMVHRDAVVVVGYGCYLRVPLFVLTLDPLWMWLGAIDMIAVVLMEVFGVLYCIRQSNEFNPA